MLEHSLSSHKLVLCASMRLPVMNLCSTAVHAACARMARQPSRSHHKEVEMFLGQSSTSSRPLRDTIDSRISDLGVSKTSRDSWKTSCKASSSEVLSCP